MKLCSTLSYLYELKGIKKFRVFIHKQFFEGITWYAKSDIWGGCLLKKTHFNKYMILNEWGWVGGCDFPKKYDK